MNHVFRATPVPYNKPTTNSFVHDTRVIQHILKNNIIPKARDHILVTPLQSIVTFFVLSRTQLDVVHLLIHYIDSLYVARDSNYRKKPNLALGHLIFYILKVKYNMSSSSSLNYILTLLTDKSFHIFYDTKKRFSHNATRAEEELT